MLLNYYLSFQACKIENFEKTKCGFVANCYSFAVVQKAYRIQSLEKFSAHKRHENSCLSGTCSLRAKFAKLWWLIAKIEFICDPKLFNILNRNQAILCFDYGNWILYNSAIVILTKQADQPIWNPRRVYETYERESFTNLVRIPHVMKE